MSWSLLIGLVLLANYQGGRSQCQTGALLYYLYPNGDICYWILSLHNPKNGGDSSTACKAEGGDLAYIPNIFALSTVMNLLVNNNANVSGFYAYLGYSRVDSSSSLLEIQGSRYVQDWIPWDTKMDQPLDTDLGCIALHGINGFWHDMHCANNIKALCSTPYYLIGSQSTVSSATTQKPPSSITTTQESIRTPIITTQNPTTTTSTTRDLTTTTTSTQEPTTTTRTTQNPRTTTTTTIGPTTTTRTTQSPTTTATTRELTTTTTTTQELTTTRGHSTTHGPSTTNGPTTTIKTTQDQTTSALTQVSTTTKSATTFQNPTSNNVISTTLTTHDPTTASTSAQLTSTSMEDISPPNTTECTCYCDQIQFFAAVNMTEELQAKLENLKEETRVDEESLSSSVRKRTSAHDPRPSAAYVGYLGIALLSLVFGGIFLVDCLRVILSVS